MPMVLRTYLALALGLALLASQCANAQEARRLAVLMAWSEKDVEAQSRLAAFKLGLTALGWIEGKNVEYEIHWSEGGAHPSSALARKVVTRRPDVIVSTNTPLTSALKAATSTIPIVTPNNADPVGSGFAKSLARPGGNITGSVNFESSLAGKWLEILIQIAPRVKRVAVMFNPDTAPFANYYLEPLRASAQVLRIELTNATVRTDADVSSKIADCGRDRGCGMLVFNDSYMATHRKTVLAAVAKFKVPAVYPTGNYVAEGGLISYGSDQVELFRSAATYVDRILRGTNPTDLPIQLPSKFELFVNLKTARELGLAVPQSLLDRADRLIQ